MELPWTENGLRSEIKVMITKEVKQRVTGARNEAINQVIEHSVATYPFCRKVAKEKWLVRSPHLSSLLFGQGAAFNHCIYTNF